MVDGVFINFDKEGCSLITFEGGGDEEVLSLADLLVIQVGSWRRVVGM